jgi:hypothetical protein
LSCDGSSSIEVILLGLSLVELLEKAQGVTNKAYGHSLRSFACIEGALDRMPKGTKGGEELAQLLGKAQSVQKTIAEIQQCITQTTETLSQEVRQVLLYLFRICSDYGTGLRHGNAISSKVASRIAVRLTTHEELGKCQQSLLLNSNDHVRRKELSTRTAMTKGNLYSELHVSCSCLLFPSFDHF